MSLSQATSVVYIHSHQKSKKKSDLIVLTMALDSKKEVAKVLGQLFYIGLQDKQIINLALSLHSKPNHKQEHVGTSTTRGSLKRLADKTNL